MEKESREKREEKVRSLRPIDDLLFRELGKDEKVVQEMLRVILQDDKLIVRQVIPQYVVPNVMGRGVQLDAFCELGDGRECNIEVQRANNDDHLRRMRYNVSGVTWTETVRGISFKDIPNLCIIYISESDFLGGGRVLYHVDEVIRETGKRVDDGLEKVIVNADINDHSKIANLMRCFLQTEVSSREFPELTRKMNWVKHTEEGIRVMSAVIEKFYGKELQEAREEALKQGETNYRTKLNLLRQKMQSEKADMSEYMDATTNEDILERLCKKYGIS